MDNQKDLEIINGQLFGTFIILISIIISLYVAYNQKLKVMGEEPLIDDETLNDLVFWNRIILTIIIAYFLYLSYETVELTNQKGEDCYIAKAQYLASFLAFLAGLVSLYVVLYNRKGSADVNDVGDIIEQENPEI